MAQSSTSRRRAHRGWAGGGAKLLEGMVLSGVLMIGGFWLIENTSPILAVGPLAAGFYVLMYAVADGLVPGASPMATRCLKLWTLLVFLEWTPLVFWLMWAGNPL